MTDKIKGIVMSATVAEVDRVKLYCKTAFELAEKYNIELFDIARVCNKEGIKIAKCQLECFD